MSKEQLSMPRCDIEELNKKIKILSKKVIQLKPELEDWIKKNFVDSWHDSEEE